MKLLAISGSLRAESSNTRLLKVAERCKPTDVSVTIADCLEHLPQFNPDHDPNDREVTKDWVDQVRQAKGLIVSTPEYAGGYPGSLKNALDWLVQTDAHLNKPFMMLHASKRSFTARDTLTKVLETMDGKQIVAANRTIHLVGNHDSVDQLFDQYSDTLQEAMNEFVAAILKMEQE